MNNDQNTRDDDDDDLPASFNVDKVEAPPKPARPLDAAAIPAGRSPSTAASDAGSAYAGKVTPAPTLESISTDVVKLDFPQAEPRQADRKPFLATLRERLLPATAAREAQRQPQTERQAGQNQRGIIMGPARSGKTFLLLAIGRACFLPGKETYDLRFTPEPPATDPAFSDGDPVEKQSVSELMRRSVRIITGEDRNRRGTMQATDYSFGLSARGEFPGRFGRTSYVSNTLSLTVSDGPGGALFTDDADEKASGTEIERWQTHLVSRARKATSLILCVDATDRRLPLLEKQLPGLVDGMGVDFEIWQKASFEQSILDRVINLWRRNEPPMECVKMRCLNVDNFLLLLTKVDLLCAGVDRPDLLAAKIKPVQTAVKMLGLPFLNMIRQSLKPEARFAIGVASALGFYPGNGLPLADEEGLVRRGEQTDDDILSIWKPFGVRDALFFIATGHATGSVKLVSPQDLRDANDRY